MIEAGFDTVLTGARGVAPLPHGDLDRARRTACRASWPPRTTGCSSCARGGHRDAGGLVVAADSEHARGDRQAAARRQRQAADRRPPHRARRAAKKLADFTASRDEWIVAVNMVSEGVDIPRLRVGVYATAAKTPLIFRQIVGRFVRTIAGPPARACRGSTCRPTRSCAGTRPTSRASCATCCARLGEEEGLLDELRERARDRAVRGRWSSSRCRPTSRRRRSCRSSAAPRSSSRRRPSRPRSARPRRSPCSRRAGVPARLTSGAGGSRSTARPEPSPVGLPAFQRRTLLRDKRHRLVGDLGAATGSSHREINSWLNRAAGLCAGSRTRRSISSRRGRPPAQAWPAPSSG